MQVINPQLITGKKVLLRLDIDVPIENGKVTEDFRLRAGLPTLKMCLENASQVIVIGHIGRPTFADSASVATSAKGAATAGKPDKFFIPKYSVAPIVEWFNGQGLSPHLTSGKLKVLENLRFDSRESFDEVYTERSRSAQDREAGMEFAKELASMSDPSTSLRTSIFVNEAFASYRPAVSTTVLPTLLPHAVGLRFAEEVRVLREVRDNPKKPFIVIMGGAKVADKLPVINVLAQKADAVLVGGKLIHELRVGTVSLPPALPRNVMVGMLTEDGFDIAPQTVSAWAGLIAKAVMIVWNGPVGRIEDPNLQFTIYNLQNKTEENLGSARGSYEIAEMLLASSADIIIGGGDTVGFLGKVGLLEKFEQKGFVSTGGGAMLKFLAEGTLPTIEALR